ncbi:XRE family transcriptional regulator [Actinomadura sp. KC06]|uniref:helix-turn-helix domain-containing protein n=1 Tax=Actinomadura sp. KC06 TaxID=2530369 RepID=UPI00104BA3B4|nr:helix-turn-helix transcriptional regulator [Actinomadura sp. KC06]TDD36002.1 XRE family transcriptional regulator [Actinomadura sp. KC06]
MVLGARLRRLRESCLVTREQAGDAIRASHSKISRLELGRTGFKLRDVDDLLTLYGVDDEAERDTLLALARQANTPGWWQPYCDLIPDWAQGYIGLEQAADVIRTYEVQFVPGLLQTGDYARAVIRLGHRPSVEELCRRVELRMRRQQILTRPDPCKLWAIVDEAALRRPIGGAEVMRAQLRHLVEVSGRPGVTVQVLPFRVGGHAAAGGPFSVVRLPERDLLDVVYLEQLTNAQYLNKQGEVDYYRHVMNQLGITATESAGSLELLHTILKET